MSGLKGVLHGYLRQQRKALLWKLENLGERKARMPMTGTGSNVLGIVKHVASVESGYLGAVFGRPGADPLPWMSEAAEQDAEWWARYNARLRTLAESFAEQEA